MSFEVSSDWYQRFFGAEWLDLAKQWSILDHNLT
jgi:hypothetical protein